MQIRSLSKGRFKQYWKEQQLKIGEMFQSCKIGQTRIEKGDRILSQGQTIDNLILVHSGFISLSHTSKNGKRFQLGGMHCQEQLFGEMEFFTQYPCQLDIIAEEQLQLQIISGEALENILLANPKFALFFSSAMAIDYQDTLDIMLYRTLYSIAYNIAHELYHEYYNSNVLTPLSKRYHEAERFGTTDRVYRRALKELELKGLIKINKQKIVIMDINKIEKYLVDNKLQHDITP